MPATREQIAFNAACSQSRVLDVERLVRAGAPLDAQTAKGMSAAMYAAECGMGATLKIVLEAGANPNLLAKKGRSAAMFAARAGSVECLALLIEAGCDIRAKDANGLDVLSYAQQANNRPCVEMVKRELERLEISDAAIQGRPGARRRI
jgi:ankyrin repeat protein